MRQERGSGTALTVITPALDGTWLPALAEWQRGRPGSALVVLIVPTPLRASDLEERLAAVSALLYIYMRGGSTLAAVEPATAVSNAANLTGSISVDFIKVYLDFRNNSCVSTEFGSYATRNTFP
jgi:hypothetical protein